MNAHIYRRGMDSHLPGEPGEKWPLLPVYCRCMILNLNSYSQLELELAHRAQSPMLACWSEMFFSH